MSDKIKVDVPTVGNGPNVQTHSGAINPSAPSTGTASAGDVRHTSYPQNEAAQNPAAWEAQHTRAQRMFHCADALQKECGWSVTGNNEEEILGYLRSHARQAHGKNEFTPNELENARRAIHKRAA